MQIATQYAKALEGIEKPDFSNFKETLVRRGHQKLLPRIFSEYQKLLLSRERRESRATETPEQKQTRVLLELYQKLTK